MQNFTTIDQYIKSCPTEIQPILQKLREVIKNEIPESEESIRYGLATFRLDGKNLVHFGGFKTHIGFYPAPSGIDAFEEELKPYRSGKGTIQFPLDTDLPWELIQRVVQYRVQEVAKK